MSTKITCVMLCFTLGVAQTQKMKCSCAQLAGFNQYSFTPPMADAKDHCTVAWTCKTTQCAYYNNKEQDKDAIQFVPPVTEASFDAIVVDKHVEAVKVSVECPQKGFVAKDLSCPCEMPPPPPTTQGNSQVRPEERAPALSSDHKTAIAVAIVIVLTVLGSMAVVCVLRRWKKNQAMNRQDHQQVPGNNPDEHEENENL